MGRPRKKKTSEEVVMEGVQKSREEYLQTLVNTGVFEAPKAKTQSNREMFSEFWARYTFVKKKAAKLEDIIWAHLVSIKHDKPDLFEAGIKNFGL